MSIKQKKMEKEKEPEVLLAGSRGLFTRLTCLSLVFDTHFLLTVLVIHPR